MKNYYGTLFPTTEVSASLDTTSEPLDMKQHNSFSLHFIFEGNTLEGAIQLYVSNDNGRDSQTDTVSISNWELYSSSVPVDTTSDLQYFIEVEEAYGNWYRFVFNPSAGSASDMTVKFSAKR